ncbi:MAG: MFS transporter [Promethearchaeota archaeon]
MQELKKASNKPRNFQHLSGLKRFWPIFLIQSSVSISVAGLMLNMLAFSLIIWPEDTFHSLEMGVIISLKLILLAIAGLFFGSFADRYSRKHLFFIYLLIMGIAKILNGYAAHPLMFAQFMLCYSMLGVGQGGIAPTITSFSNDSIDQATRSRFFGVLETVKQVSIIVGMITSAWLVQVGLWRLYFWITGYLLIFTAIISLVFIKEPKRGIKHHALTNLLSQSNMKYKYRLNKNTVKSTIFSPTNIIAFVEGIFTWILFSIAIYLIYPYIQSPPYNVSPVVSSFLMIIFGIPGAIFGSLAFSRLSDRLSQRNARWRIYMIILSLVILFIVVILLFIVPLPHVSKEDGNSLAKLMTYPVMVVFGILIFILRSVLGIYNMNQTPLLQKINLPEAQGMISSWNQFLETIGYGLGPLISGYLLTQNNQNYVITAVTSLIIGIPSIFMWSIANKWLESDITRIDAILERRAREMKEKELKSGENKEPVVKPNKSGNDKEKNGGKKPDA